ncbi:type 1 glutamine amidotransferase [Corynebacterium poyangense]|uniref:Type 1 glutamine amidotransferase n=1 Tax=Corynebacterium poyangense TaxID=2684405 RepID=A0A7H0SRJ9_9CORY|nr:type 1 glutamine amidotransferase [Corynebacterium poyangense]MBZ8176605.1 type 1 glutamine amidotransferase [Corynebacterium poyangense]QNQ91174.1 type 1 glutamine amidotransferase [Corynebacterium poyangense]
MIIIEHQESADLDRLVSWTPGATVYRPYLGQRLPDILQEPLIVLGGAMNAYQDQDYSWLPRTRQLLSIAIEKKIPVLGICLGAQLLSVAAGGGVAIASSAGTELGLTQISLTETAAKDPLFCGLPQQIWVASDHSDGITPLPQDAVLLAKSARYPQAFRVGPCAWGVQFHPEAGLNRLQQWIKEDIHLLPGASPEREAELIEQARQYWAEVTTAAHQLITRFVALSTGKS